MAWVVLAVAGLMEVVWLYLLKAANGLENKGYALAGWAIATASVWLLGMALKGLPVGTAYAVWTGIGALGGAAMGIILFDEPATPLRMLCIALVVVGIIGLKIIS